MPRFVIPLTAVALLALAALLSPVALRAGAAQESGRRLYEEKGCAGCHGLAGQGAVTGPRLADKATQLDAFTHQVRQPSNEMPSYSEKVLSGDEVRAIYDYIRSIPSSPHADDLPLLRPFETPAAKDRP